MLLFCDFSPTLWPSPYAKTRHNYFVGIPDQNFPGVTEFSLPTPFRPTDLLLNMSDHEWFFFSTWVTETCDGRLRDGLLTVKKCS